jgi:hypothetical protein
MRLFKKIIQQINYGLILKEITLISYIESALIIAGIKMYIHIIIIGITCGIMVIKIHGTTGTIIHIISGAIIALIESAG